ncbi:hypothetical protein [Tardiphaga sp. 862_B3_N1_1]|uniref:hypothetical protein n=1 Tax=Tardiphaga sp. 862_B3_N1_1 TaxID=3240763 RepID=UPI003F88F93C
MTLAQIATNTSKRTAPSRLAKARATDTNPPVIVTKPSLTEPHPVYGNIPMGCDGFVLENQLIQMLDRWHQTATDYIDALPSDSDDAWLPIVRVVQGQLFDAALNYKPRRGADAACQFAIMAREMKTEGTIELLDVEAFQKLVDGLRGATSPLRPTKVVPAATRGRKLTRSGLLQRYHAFLVQELQTLSCALYGPRDFAAMTRIEDDVVNERCNRFGSVFFDEGTLPDRARSVLKSLKIDAEMATVKPRKGGSR